MFHFCANKVFRKFIFKCPFLLLALLLPFGCVNESGANASNKTGSPPGKPPSVVVQEVRPQTVHIPSEFVARTVADQTVEIRARVEGFLLEATFEEGKPVKSGQLLFRIDPTVYEANRQSAKAQLTKAEADLTLAQNQVSLRAADSQLRQAEVSLNKADQDVARIEPLVREEALPQQDLDAAIARQQVAQADVEVAKANQENVSLGQQTSIEQAQAAVEAAKAAVVKAELDLSYTEIRCPIDGLIGRQEVSVGNLVGRGEPTLLATVSTTDPMRVDFSISETDYVTLVKRFLAGEFTQEAADLELILVDGSVYPHKGVLVMFGRSLDPTTATIPLSASFPNPDSLLRPGLFARVRTTVRTVEDALLVPQRAVVEMLGAKTVMVVGPDNVVAVRTVSLGDRYQDSYVALSGVQAGDRVLVEGLQKAQPGKPVMPDSSLPAEGK